MLNKRYSVFIAYHGTYAEGGSRVYAEKIYEYLKGKGLSCFYFPVSNRNGNYKANIKEIMESSLFILVCTNGIKKERNGRINIREHLDLYTEIDTFWGLTQLGEVTINDSTVVAIGNDFKKGSESFLHPLFQDRVALFFDDFNEHACGEVYTWVKDRLKEKEELTEGISFEIKKLYSKRNKIKINDLQELIKKAVKIQSIGISNTTICDMNIMDAVSEFLKKGGELEILFLDPDSENTRRRTIEECLHRKGRIAVETKKSFDIMLDTINDCECPVYAKLYLYDLVPRINALFIDDTLILQYYSYNNMGKDNPTLLIERTCSNSPLFDYTKATFEYVRSVSKERRDYYYGD